MALLRSVILTLFLCSLLPAAAQSLKEDSYTVTETEGIRLTNVRSTKSESIDVERPGKKILVIVFLSPECPLCQQYSLQLNALADQLRKEAAIIGIFPGKSYDRKTILTYLKKYKVKFPAYIDGSKKLTHYLNASVTPEVIVLSNEKDKVATAYRGAIDDRVISLRTKKLKATNYYVKDAIDQILLKEEIAVRRTEPVGCLINDL